MLKVRRHNTVPSYYDRKHCETNQIYSNPNKHNTDQLGYVHIQKIWKDNKTLVIPISIPYYS